MMRTSIGILLVVVLFAILVVAGWFFARDRIVSQPEYRLAAENISVSQIPDWVPAAFVSGVLQNAGLDRSASLFDKELPRKIAEAFSAYPWVETVEKVELRYPSGADVRLNYRVPIAFVEVPQGRYLVDGNGILLPTDYFAKIAPDKHGFYLTIQGIRTTPLGTIGTPWGDPLVSVGAQLAGVLNKTAEQLKITRIIPLTEETPTSQRTVCKLKTAGNTEILWGSFSPDDPNNDVKLKRLLDIAAKYRSLDNVPMQFKPIDLRKE